LQESIGELERQYKSAFPGDPFEYYFLNDFYDQQYREDRQFEDIFNLFTVAGIVIACMGLWGLASHTVAIRMKEMSLRRVLGASTMNVITLLLIQFLTLIVLAGIIALPVSWYAMKDWLSNFAFRIDLTWDLFVVPLAILLAISIATIGGQIIRCLTSNPVDVLRSE
jgi:putative ABC transport system permease protein